MDENGVESTEELHFFYDAQSIPAFVEYDGVMYRYIHNLQGDIVAIVDAAGNLVVEYKHDAWGSPIFTTGSLKTTLGELSPFRYRGYVFDMELELYYLYARCYSPRINRFLSADTLISVGRKSLFVYCENKPVVTTDSTGNKYTYDAINPHAKPISSSSVNDVPSIKDLQEQVLIRKTSIVKQTAISPQRYRWIESKFGAITAPPNSVVINEFQVTATTQRQMQFADTVASQIKSNAISSVSGLLPLSGLNLMVGFVGAVVDSGGSTLPPVGTYRAVKTVWEIEEKKSIIAGYDHQGNPYPGYITRPATVTVIDFFDSGENAKGTLWYLESNYDPRFD